MSERVFVQERWDRRQLHVFVTRGAAPDYELAQLDENGWVRWVHLPEAAHTDDAPTFAIDVEWAHAVLDALMEHLGGTTNERALRADYDHERKRVDDLLGAVTLIVTQGRQA